jgi:hypothetical protein
MWVANVTRLTIAQQKRDKRVSDELGRLLELGVLAMGLVQGE